MQHGKNTNYNQSQTWHKWLQILCLQGKRHFIGNFEKLADVRRHWLREIKLGQVVLVRELDRVPNMSEVEAVKAVIESILEHM